MPEQGSELDGGVELLVRLAQETTAGVEGSQVRYYRELTYRAALLADPERFDVLRLVLDGLVREVGQARDAELHDRAVRRGLAGRCGAAAPSGTATCDLRAGHGGQHEGRWFEPDKLSTGAPVYWTEGAP